jgi:hypothetical protein
MNYQGGSRLSNPLLAVRIVGHEGGGFQEGAWDTTAPAWYLPFPGYTYPTCKPFSKQADHRKAYADSWSHTSPPSWVLLLPRSF